MTEGLRPIHLLPAREYVASALRDAILGRKLPINEPLTLDTVSKMLNVSKTPVREAFQILERDGLIKLIPNKGALIQEITSKDITDSYELRVVLECAAVEQICLKEKPIDSIREAVEELEDMRRRMDYQEFANNNLRFHQAIWYACGNERLQSTVQQLCSGLNLTREDASTESVSIVYDQHKALLDALERRDVEASKETMKNHILRTMNIVLERLNV